MNKYYEFMRVLEDSKNIDEIVDYLKDNDNWICILGNDNLDYMSNAFSNKYQFYDGMLEDLINRKCVVK